MPVTPVFRFFVHAVYGKTPKWSGPADPQYDMFEDSLRDLCETSTRMYSCPSAAALDCRAWLQASPYQNILLGENRNRSGTGSSRSRRGIGTCPLGISSLIMLMP